MEPTLKDGIPSCECGCGELVKWHKKHKRWNRFIIGHNRKGTEFSEEHKRKLSGKNHPMFGKHFSEETKRKMRENRPDIRGEDHHLFGKKHSEETKRKMGLALSGENSPNWKGEISCEPYCDIWLDKEYKENIKERDNYQCQNPDCWGNCSHLSLHTHHINYIKKDCIPQNLITLCCGCNMRANTNREYWQQLYENIIITNNHLKKEA